MVLQFAIKSPLNLDGNNYRADAFITFFEGQREIERRTNFLVHYCLLRSISIMAEFWQSFLVAIIVVITAGGWPGHGAPTRSTVDGPSSWHGRMVPRSESTSHESSHCRLSRRGTRGACQVISSRLHTPETIGKITSKLISSMKWRLETQRIRRPVHHDKWSVLPKMEQLPSKHRVRSRQP